MTHSMATVHIHAGEHVISEGEPGSTFYVIVKGTAVVLTGLVGRFRREQVVLYHGVPLARDVSRCAILDRGEDHTVRPRPRR